jgi:hypothetical protein
MIGVFVGFSWIFLLGILIFKGFTARRLYKSFGVKGLFVSYIFIEKACLFEYKVEFLLKNGNKMSLEFFSCSESAILKRNMYMGITSKQ